MVEQQPRSPTRGKLIIKPQPKFDHGVMMTVYCCALIFCLYTLMGVQFILPDVNCVISGCHDQSLNFDLGCKTAWSAFVLVDSHLFWYYSGELQFLELAILISVDS